MKILALGLAVALSGCGSTAVGGGDDGTRHAGAGGTAQAAGSAEVAAGGAGASEGVGGSGSACAPPEVLLHDPMSGEIVCGGFDEDSKLVPHPDFDACSSPPNSACGHDAFCAVEACGDPDSAYDEQGCRRATCGDGADCPSGQVCHAVFEGCLAVLDVCGPAGDGTCTCVANGMCVGGSICVDEATVD